MKKHIYPVGTKLKPIHGLSVWAEYYVLGKSNVIFEVAGIVEGTDMERVALRIVGETGLAYPGISPDQFEKVES